MEHSPAIATPGPAGLVASAREAVTVLSETLWAAARPEDLLEVTVEMEAASVAGGRGRATDEAAEVEATEAAKTAGWVSPGDDLTSVSGGRRGHGQRLLRTARGLCGSRTATLLALTAGGCRVAGARRGDRRLERPAAGGAGRCGTRPSGCSARPRPPRSTPPSCGRPATTSSRSSTPTARPAPRRSRTRPARAVGAPRLGSAPSPTTASAASGSADAGPLQDAAAIKTALHALAAPLPGTDPHGREAGRVTCMYDGARTWGMPSWRPAPTRPSRQRGRRPEQHGAKPRLTVTVTLDQPPRAGLVTATSTPATTSVTAIRRLACDADEATRPCSAPSARSSTSAAPSGSSPPRTGKPRAGRRLHCRSPAACRMPLACDARTTTSPTGPTAATRHSTTSALACRAHHTLLGTRLIGRVSAQPGRPPARVQPQTYSTEVAEGLDHPHLPGSVHRPTARGRDGETALTAGNLETRPAKDMHVAALEAPATGRVGDDDFDTLFFAHASRLVRLAALLGAADPEDVVQEAFAKVDAAHDPPAGPPGPGRALPQPGRGQRGPRPAPPARRWPGATPTWLGGSGDQHLPAFDTGDRSAVVAELRALPPRQREALVLRYWLHLPLAAIADAMGAARAP